MRTAFKRILLLSLLISNSHHYARAAERIKAIQVNIFCSGRYTEDDMSRDTWDTAHRFAKLLASPTLEDTAVIGMQEVDPLGFVQLIKILREDTGQPWSGYFYIQGTDDAPSGNAIFYNPRRIVPVRDFGSVMVAQTDAGYRIRFGGALFKTLGEGAPFGFFTGKLSWNGAIIDGKPVDDEDRSEQAKKLRAFIAAKMAPTPEASRIVAMDMNGGFRSKVWHTLSEEFFDNNERAATFNSRFPVLGLPNPYQVRYDYLWWDYDGSSRRMETGFLDGPRRSMHFGSDHRFVWGDLLIKR